MDKVRARISQFIIFPQHRRSGVGIKFLRCVYNIIRDTIPNLKDITVEDPNDKFRIIRAITNVSTVFFHPPVIAKLNLSDPENIDFITEMCLVFKFSKEESDFIADIIKYISANLTNNTHVKRQVITRLRKRFTIRYTVSSPIKFENVIFIFCSCIFRGHLNATDTPYSTIGLN